MERKALTALHHHAENRKRCGYRAVMRHWMPRQVRSLLSATAPRAGNHLSKRPNLVANHSPDVFDMSSSSDATSYLRPPQADQKQILMKTEAKGIACHRLKAWQARFDYAFRTCWLISQSIICPLAAAFHYSLPVSHCCFLTAAAFHKRPLDG